MAIELKPTKEYFLRGEEQDKELLSRQKENQKWVYYVIIGSFGLITFLNFMIPDYHWNRPEPIEIKWGFVGMILTFFGSIFFLRAFFVKGGSEWFDLYWWLSVILSIILLYFGLPIILG
jgi:hypothetical protein